VVAITNLLKGKKYAGFILLEDKDEKNYSFGMGNIWHGSCDNGES
jgi:hypothetical protein